MKHQYRCMIFLRENQILCRVIWRTATLQWLLGPKILGSRKENNGDGMQQTTVSVPGAKGNHTIYPTKQRYN